MCDYCAQPTHADYCSDICEELSLIGPAAFNRCVSGGGRVRTVKPSAGSYIHVCFKNKHSYAGEVKHVKDAIGQDAGTLKVVDMTEHLEVHLVGDRFDSMNPGELRAMVRRLWRDSVMPPSTTFVMRNQRQELEELQHEMREREARVERLNAIVKNLEAQGQRLETDPTRQELEALRTEKSRLERQVEQERSELVRALKNSDADQLRQQLVVTRQELAEARKPLEAMQRRVEVLERQIAARDQQLAQGLVTEQSLGKNMLDLQEEKKRAEEVVAQLTRNLERSRTTNAEFKRRLQDLQTRLETESVQATGNLDTERRKAKDALAQLQAELEMYKQGGEFQAKRYREELALREKLTVKLDDAERRLRSGQATIMGQSNTVARLHDQLQALTREYHSSRKMLTDDLEAARKQLADSDVGQLKAQTKKLEGDLVDLKQRYDKRLEELTKEQNKQLACDAERNRAYAEITALKKELAETVPAKDTNVARALAGLQRRYDILLQQLKVVEGQRSVTVAEKATDDQLIFNLQLQLEHFLYLKQLGLTFDKERQATEALLKSAGRLRALHEIRVGPVKRVSCSICQMSALVVCAHCGKKYCSKHYV